MIRISGSKSALVLRCGYWTRQDVELGDHGPTAAAALGLAVHDASETRQNGQAIDIDAIAAARGLTDDQRARLPSMLDALAAHVVPRDARAEVTFAFDWRTGEARELGRSLGRAYEQAGLREDEIPGAADLVWFEGERGETVVIADIKSGVRWQLADHEEQLLFLAMCARKAYRSERAVIMTLPVGDDGAIADKRTIEAYELEHFEQRYRARIQQIVEGDPQPEPGPHCRSHWCPAIAACPEAHDGMARIIPSAELVPRYRLSGPIASMDEAAYRLRLLPMLQAAVKTLETELRAYADEHGPIETDDGPWGRIDAQATSLTPTPDAIAIIERELGAEGARVAVESSVTQASIKRAVEALGIRPVAPAVRRIVQALENVGAVTTSARTTYAVRKARKGAA